jgi:hypothetical protein
MAKEPTKKTTPPEKEVKEDIVYLVLEERKIKPIGHGFIRIVFDVEANADVEDDQLDSMAEAFKVAAKTKIEKPVYDEIDVVMKALQARCFERDNNGKIAMFPQRDGTKAPQVVGKEEPIMRIHSRLLNCIDELMAGGKKKITIEFHQHRGLTQPNWDDMLELFAVMERYIFESSTETASWILDFYDKLVDAKDQAAKLIPKKKS